MSFSEITAVDLVVNQIVTVVTKYSPSSPAGINTTGDIVPAETIVRTSSNVGLNRINTTPILSNTVQVYNPLYSLGNQTFNYLNLPANLPSTYGANALVNLGGQTFGFNTVGNATPVVDRGASLGNQNFPVYDSVPSVNSIDPVLELSTPVSISPGGSLAFNGAGNLVVTVGASAALTFGTNPFTIECWLFLTGTGGNYTIYDARNASSAVAVNFYFQGGNILSLMVSTTNVIAGTAAVTAGVWHHVALSKNSGSTRIFLDGIQIGSTYADSNNYLSSGPTIGKNSVGGGGANNLAGYIANFRIVNGTGLYTTQFTPSITAANIANTQLLLSVNSSATYLTDSSVNNFSFTSTGVVYSTLVPSVPGTPAYYTTQYFNSGLNIPYGDITANVSAYSAQTYTTPGTYTWTVPAGVYSITVGAVGAGGGGVQKTGGGTGGNGGNVAYYNSYTVTPGETYTVVVGTGGAPGGVFGTTGGSTYMTRPSSNVAVVVAGGGAGGSSLYWQTDDISVQTLDSSGIIARISAADPSLRTITYSISSGSLPTGAVLNTANGAITWTKQNLSSSTEYTPFTVSAAVTGPAQTITKRYTIQIVTTSYAVTASTANVVLYGTSITFYVRTTGVADGTTLYWTNGGSTTTDEFIDGINSGPITITGGAFNIVRTLTAIQSVPGSSRNIIIQLRTGSISGTVVATGPTIAVAPQTFAIASNVAAMNEGTSVQYTVTTANVATGTVVYWTDSGNVAAGRFSDAVISGTVTLNSNSAIVVRSVINNLLLDGITNTTLQARNASTIGAVIGTSTPVIVNDTSTGPTVEYLVVGGGGGGGRGNGNGGTGGQVLTGTFVANSGSTLSTSIGGGAAGGTSAALSATGGSSSLTNAATSVTALGGAGATGSSSGQGVGGGAAGGAASGTKNGNDGPSTAIISTTVATTYSIGQVSGGTVYFAGGGGGGNTNGGSAGIGGNGGLGGGGGGSGSQGTGGGGQPYAGGSVGRVGLVNSGAGGGGGSYPNHGSAGADGVVIVRYLNTYPAATSTTGSPAYVIDGSYRVYIFTSGGSITL
jgi:hypothetical protein